MADEPDDLVLSILREMREESRQFRQEMQAFREDMQAFREETSERLGALDEQVTGMGGVIYAIYSKMMTQEERLSDLETTMREPAE